MKTQNAFSLVELLLVIAVIAVVAAIAIPNVAGITQNAQDAADRRNAQNLASMSSAAIASGATKAQLGNDVPTVVSNLIRGLSVTNGPIVNGPFRVEGLSPNATGYTNYLSYFTNTGGLLYNQAP